MAAVDFRDVRKSYRDQEVIHGVNAEVADGEFVVIVGPSGCGKSTLLRMVAGLEMITAGEIRIGDRVVNHLEPKDRDIAMVFQNYALYPHMSVYDNMAYGLRIRGLPAAEIEERVQRAAQILELGGVALAHVLQRYGGHYFSVSTSPLTNHFCISITTSAGGSIARIAVAMITFHSLAASPPANMRLMPITIG